MEPIIVEPAGFTPEQGWDECHSYVEKCGGLMDGDGVNWRAAFGADPGICSCPACHQKYWAWGTVQQCVTCGFKYPTNWWPMYSYGVSAATAVDRGAKVHIWVSEALRALHDRRMESSAYYRYGYEHPVPDAWKEHERIDWRAVFPQPHGDQA
jgi:hypothetical protein